MPIEPLGIDNVVFDVDDLDAAVAFYERCGLQMRWRSETPGLALFAIGVEMPGLLLRTSVALTARGRLWVEVRDANGIAADLKAAGVQTIRIETRTGLTVEARDPSGNTIGFADYSRMPDRGRPSS